MLALGPCRSAPSEFEFTEKSRRVSLRLLEKRMVSLETPGIKPVVFLIAMASGKGFSRWHLSVPPGNIARTRHT